VTITSNDAYYINDPGVAPEIQLGVLGGCLQSFDALHFGIGGANTAPVHNTGEQGNQDEQLFEIDGNDSRYWQGGLFFMAEAGDPLEPPFSMS
jgi:hypothetical protein